MKNFEPNTPIVELVNITKGYEDEPILEDFNLTINNGEFVTILGPSGCGKTTILRLIAGLEDADDGVILLDNQDITDIPSEKRHVNTVFQSYALFPHLSIYENVAFGLRMQKVPENEIKPRVLEALSMVQLAEYVNRSPHQLSGGQQQRVAIARAVVNKPKVLLLDEPLSALDYKLRKRMQNELKALQRQLDITFIFVTHDQEEALTMSDRIVVLRDGIIQQQGSPRDIYEHPKNLFVAKFIGVINVLEAEVIKRIDEKTVEAYVEGLVSKIYVEQIVTPGMKLKVLLRPEDMLIEEIYEREQAEGIVGYVKERSYKGMTLESTIELDTGKTLVISEFFNENDPDVDHPINQQVSITWIEGWEVVLSDDDDA